MSSAVNGVSGIAIAAYLGLVVWQGNISTLFTDIQQDYGYLEFLVAMVVLYQISKIPELHEIVISFVVVAVIGLLLTKGQGSAILTYLQNFGSGKIGLFGESKSTLVAPVNATVTTPKPATIGA